MTNTVRVVAETPRLILRHFEAADRPALSAVFGDNDVMHFGPGVRPPAWIDAWLTDRLGLACPTPCADVWAVVERDTGSVTGYCGLFEFPDLAGRFEIEIGYRLARAWWGRGFATEAARAVRDYGFEVLSLSRLVALIDPGNRPSIRVAEKLGMRYERDVMLPEYTHPDHLYVVAR